MAEWYFSLSISSINSKLVALLGLIDANSKILLTSTKTMRDCYLDIRYHFLRARVNLTKLRVWSFSSESCYFWSPDTCWSFWVSVEGSSRSDFLRSCRFLRYEGMLPAFELCSNLLPFAAIDSVGFEEFSFLVRGPGLLVDGRIEMIMPPESNRMNLYRICLDVLWEGCIFFISSAMRVHLLWPCSLTRLTMISSSFMLGLLTWLVHNRLSIRIIKTTVKIILIINTPSSSSYNNIQNTYQWEIELQT